MSAEPHDDHGHSPAAWTLVVLVMLGFLVGSIAMVAASEVGVWVGVGIVILGCVVGKVMQMMRGDSTEHATSTSASGAIPEA